MSVPKTILFATSNPHKIEEVADVLDPLGVRIVGLGREGRALPEPVEDGTTFTTNAVIKARYYASHLGCVALADDSGLCVDALGGAPGVRSARYADASGPRETVDPANNEKLIQELRGVTVEKRTARFVCVMALCDPKRTRIIVRGTVEGRIIHEPRGNSGFGYDPLFLLPDRGATTAQLSPRQKNAISHRGRAARRLVSCSNGLIEGSAAHSPASSAWIRGSTGIEK